MRVAYRYYPSKIGRRKIQLVGDHVDLERFAKAVSGTSEAEQQATLDEIVDLVSWLLAPLQNNAALILTHYLQDQSIEELANVLAVGERDVWMQLQRARRQLKEAYEKKFEE